MTNPELFIEEVKSEIRRDRLFKLFKRYGWIGVLFVILVVGGATYREWNSAREQAEAEKFGDSIFSAIELENETDQVEALGLISTSNDDKRALVHMMLADSALEAGKTGDALAALESIALNSTASQVYKDLASLKSIMIRRRNAQPEEVLLALEPLTTPGAPFQILAREQKALALVELGRIEEAVDILETIVNATDATPGIRQRALNLGIALGFADRF